MKFNITHRLIESVKNTLYGKVFSQPCVYVCVCVCVCVCGYIYIYIYVPNEAGVWLQSQIILRRPFPGISFLKIFVMVFLIALQYHPIFFLKEHLIITVTSSLTKKPLFAIFRRVKYCRFLWSRNVGTIPSKPAITLCMISFNSLYSENRHVTVPCIFTNKKRTLRHNTEPLCLHYIYIHGSQNTMHVC